MSLACGRKDREYQALLKQQIDEKKREKAMEQKNLEEQKQRELDALKGVTKGNGGGGRRRQELDEFERIERRSEPMEDRSRDRNRQNIRDTNRDRENEQDWRQERRPIDRDDRLPRVDDRHRDNGNEYRQKGRRRDDYEDAIPDRRSQNSGDRDSVSKAEYDELSALCSRLMNQQDELKDEIDRQAQLIQVSVAVKH